MPQLLDLPTNQVKRIVGGSDAWENDFGQTVGMANRQNLGTIVKGLRASRKLTQAAAAAEIGIARSTLASIEAGHDVPGRETMVAIADFFRVSLDHLRSGAPSPGSPRTREVVEDPDELALLDFWRGLSDDQRILFYRMLALPERRDTAA